MHEVERKERQAAAVRDLEILETLGAEDDLDDLVQWVSGKFNA